MKFLEPEEVKKSLQRYKLFDPNSVLRKIDSIIEENIRNVRAGNKKNKIYNPYLSSYLLLLRRSQGSNATRAENASFGVL
jgi:hypothetical protein